MRTIDENGNVVSTEPLNAYLYASCYADSTLLYSLFDEANAAACGSGTNSSILRLNFLPAFMS